MSHNDLGDALRNNLKIVIVKFNFLVREIKILEFI